MVRQRLGRDPFYLKLAVKLGGIAPYIDFPIADKLAWRKTALANRSNQEGSRRDLKEDWYRHFAGASQPGDEAGS